MKKLLYLFIIPVFISCTLKTAMLDASIPITEQCLIIVNHTGLKNAYLSKIDNNNVKYNGEKSFFIPAGTHTLEIAYVFKPVIPGDSSVTRRWPITHEFLPGHTYELLPTARGIIIEKSYPYFNRKAPSLSVHARKEGMLNNYERPTEGAYIIFPTFGMGIFSQYTNLPGNEILGEDGRQVDGYSGIKPLIIPGIFFESGLDFGYNNFGLSLSAELNGGLAFSSLDDDPTFGASFFSLGYLFLSEIYSYKKFGLGFGYGSTGMLPSIQHYEREGAALDFFHPYLRGEIRFWLGNVQTAVYYNHYFKHNGWGVGLRIVPSGGSEKEPIFALSTLR